MQLYICKMIASYSNLTVKLIKTRTIKKKKKHPNILKPIIYSKPGDMEWFHSKQRIRHLL